MATRCVQISGDATQTPSPVAVEPAREDWSDVLERMLAGDRAAQLRLARLVTGLLAHWGAYDFRPDWPDLVQEVLLALIRAGREGRVRKAEAVFAYVRSIARHKLMDRLRARVRRGEDGGPRGDSEDLLPAPEATCQADQDLVIDVRLALERLPERKRRVIFAVYGEGRSYEQVARETGIPLGSLKRYLREGMAALRSEFAAEIEPGRLEE